MSIKTNVITPNKKEIAAVLRAYADMIQASSNDTVTVDLDITFNIVQEKIKK